MYRRTVSAGLNDPAYHESRKKDCGVNLRFTIAALLTAFMGFSAGLYGQNNGGNPDLARKAAALADSIEPLRGEPDFFPIVTQFSPLPSGKGWRGGEGPLSENMLRDTIDSIIAHGFTGIETGTGRPESETAFILNYAQSKGMLLTHHTGALELFGRETPPEPSVFSPEYADAVWKNAEKALAPLSGMPRLYNVFTYQDEPFHWGPKSFGYGPDEQRVFRERYGYDLPPDLESIRNDPVRWRDVINFRSDSFAVGWRKTLAVVRDINPRFIVTMTHDSHNTFGAGFGSHAELAVDDVYHWGGDYADMFVFDIYPYMSIDFRFGMPSVLRLPRMSQAHYTFAHMRNLTASSGKKLGFWVGTFNPAWFKTFFGEQRRAQYWSEMEMSLTAVAQGSDYLLSGYHIPVDSLHWETYGRANRLIQKAGGEILKTRKTRAKAAMLFPRSQCIQLQEEYYNVGLSFELFLRSFGELDIIHEEQVTDDRLNGYEALILFDVKLLPGETARHIASFVRKGGVVIADCVPSLDENRKPMTVMEDLFGVTGAETGRIVRTGHWLSFTTEPQRWDFRGEDAPGESIYPTDRLNGRVLGQPLDLTLVSPRPCRAADGEVLARTARENPALVRRTAGKGTVFLLGFCVQDTYFKMWQDSDPLAREQLGGLIRALTEQTGLRSHVWSSNPEIEASVRTGENGGFLFVINHEAERDDTRVLLTDLGFSVGRIEDVEDGARVSFVNKGGRTEVQVTALKDKPRILRLVPR